MFFHFRNIFSNLFIASVDYLEHLVCFAVFQWRLYTCGHRRRGILGSHRRLHSRPFLVYPNAEKTGRRQFLVKKPWTSTAPRSPLSDSNLEYSKNSSEKKMKATGHCQTVELDITLVEALSKSHQSDHGFCEPRNSVSV